MAAAYYMPRDHPGCRGLDLLDLKQCAALLKFATSVSRAPLGGFQHLHPPLTIHRVPPSFPLLLVKCSLLCVVMHHIEGTV